MKRYIGMWKFGEAVHRAAVTKAMGVHGVHLNLSAHVAGKHAGDTWVVVPPGEVPGLVRALLEGLAESRLVAGDADGSARAYALAQDVAPRCGPK